MLPQNTYANPFTLSQDSLSNLLFDLGDCFGNLCRLPLNPIHHLLPRTDAAPCGQPLTQTLNSNIPFAISHEWQHQVWRYQVSLHATSDIAPLHQHLSARRLQSIPTDDKDQLQAWLYFTGPLKALAQLDWQPRTRKELQFHRLQHLACWLKHKLQQGKSIDNLILTPLTDLPFGDGISQNPGQSFARIGKQSLPNQQRLSRLHFAIFRSHRLTEGYGLPPAALFSAAHQLAQQPIGFRSLTADLLPPETPLLILDRQQCSQLLHQLEQALI